MSTLKPPRSLAGLAFALLVTIPAAANAAPFAVVMRDGTIIQSPVRPVMAMGRVTYKDASGRRITLPASLVNLEATRKRMGIVGPTVLDYNMLKNTSARIHVLGGPAATHVPTGDNPAFEPEVHETARAFEAREEELMTEIREVRALLVTFGENSRAAKGPRARHDRLMKELRALKGQRREARKARRLTGEPPTEES